MCLSWVWNRGCAWGAWSRESFLGFQASNIAWPQWLCGFDRSDMGSGGPCVYNSTHVLLTWQGEEAIAFRIRWSRRVPDINTRYPWIPAFAGTTDRKLPYHLNWNAIIRNYLRVFQPLSLPQGGGGIKRPCSLEKTGERAREKAQGGRSFSCVVWPRYGNFRVQYVGLKGEKLWDTHPVTWAT